MKLNLYISAFLIIFQISQTFGQDFPTIGAEWYYSEGFAFSGDIDYLMIKSVKDTIIKGKDCVQLDCDGLCWNPSGTQFIYYSNDSLYHYSPDLDTFQLISCFNSSRGESWDILIKDWDESIDTVTVTVDSINSILINENTLRQLHVTYSLKDYDSEGSEIQNYDYTSRIIEKIGDVDYFFNFPVNAGLMCDDNYSQGLRCYEDPSFGFYSTGIADSCTYTYKWTGIDKKDNDLNFEIYPNPTSDRIMLKTTIHSEMTIKIYDFSGHMVLVDKMIANTELDISELSSGIYFLQLTDSKKIIGLSKIIKN